MRRETVTCTVGATAKSEKKFVRYGMTTLTYARRPEAPRTRYDATEAVLRGHVNSITAQVARPKQSRMPVLRTTTLGR